MINKSRKFKIFDSDALKNFHKRIFFSIIVFLCCYFAAVFRIAEVMIFDIDNKELSEIIIQPERGKIYDRNGQLLSANIRSYSLFAKSSKIKKWQRFEMSYINFFHQHLGNVCNSLRKSSMLIGNHLIP